MIKIAKPKATARLEFRIQTVQAQVLRGSNDRVPTPKTGNVHHKRDGDTESHLLFDWEFAPLVPSYGITPVDHRHIVCANGASEKGMRTLTPSKEGIAYILYSHARA